MSSNHLGQPLRVGLIGAGPWAELVHAPTISASDATELAGVWARRPEAARRIAETHGASTFDDAEALYDISDAVAFAVPPAVQSSMAMTAARRGCALLLEKPIAETFASAQRLADVVADTGVVTAVAFSLRYSGAVRSFLASLDRGALIGGRANFFSDAFLGGTFATPWRLEHGPLLDLGPHVLDLLDAAAGPVVKVRAHGHPSRWIGLLLDHDSGAYTEASLTGWSGAGEASGIELHTAGGRHSLDCTAVVDASTFATMVSEFADSVRAGISHELDVGRALHVQGLVDAALRNL